MLRPGAIYLAPLLSGFAFAWASALTSLYSRHWGERGGRLLTFVLRNVLGIPLFFAGFALAWLNPSPLYFIPVRWLRNIGIVLIIIGAIPVVLGHISLGFRSHMPSVKDTLVRSGIYSYMRHPIYSGIFLMLAGLSLQNPAVSFVKASLLVSIWAYVQARLEEMDLLDRMPEYRAYMRDVPRFIPWFKKRPPERS